MPPGNLLAVLRGRFDRRDTGTLLVGWQPPSPPAERPHAYLAGKWAVRSLLCARAQPS
jgi:hypothetical protein